MTPRLPALTAREIVAILEKRGFARVHQSGSHAVFRDSEGRRTTVPIHAKRSLGRGLLRRILKDANLTVDDLVRR